VRVVIAEDLFLLREGLASLLKQHDFDIAEAVDNGPALLRRNITELYREKIIKYIIQKKTISLEIEIEN